MCSDFGFIIMLEGQAVPRFSGFASRSALNFSISRSGYDAHSQFDPPPPVKTYEVLGLGVYSGLGLL